MNDIEIGGLAETGVDVTIISPQYWHPDYPLPEANVHLLEIETWSWVKQNARLVEYIGPEGHIGKVKQYMPNTAINLWGCDLFQPWWTQINILPISETNYKLRYAFEKNTKMYDQRQSPTVQVVHNQGIIAADLLQVPTVLPLKQFTDKCLWLEQQPLTSEKKLKALEQLVQEHPMLNILKNWLVIGILLYLFFKRNLENR